ncbi:pilus (MSHA type) biogenesis protein MshL [Desulfogranum japonicum]|uniref:pilus (MSHA type) biogenesis protein MshL n=1 Tax=Desulfogranum japonicum TaxID=231447 RepID=UPI0003FEC7E8|nr:pilus (MSHA type) biogenesis protein MshL [Desulfogranum japonicum]
MKLTKIKITILISLFALALTSCAQKEPGNDVQEPDNDSTAQKAAPVEPAKPAQLPVRFQTPGYLAADINSDDELETEKGAEYRLKVGATIRSTGGPQPLWDILNRLASLKNMSVSWASDVERDVLVDVNIAADDDYFEAIDNLLRQVDYYQEVVKNTIIVKYRETKQFYISIPHMKGNYNTTVGGNYLMDREAATGTEGTVKITSDENTFNVWENIQANLDVIMQQWSTTKEGGEDDAASATETETEDEAATPEQKATRRMASGSSYYTLDKSVGLITVTAPRPLLQKVELYINTLKKELYRQVILEAKIIEVYLQDNSKIGLDWSAVLKDFDITGYAYFGNSTDADVSAGQVYPWIPAEGDEHSVTRFISKITMDPLNFSVMLNALNEQGDANVLSNPKITVLNGQPALISVGRDIAYVKEMEREEEVSDGVRTVTYSITVDNVVEGVSLGVVASILDDDKVILHLTPVTTDLIDDPIQYRTFGNVYEVGLPRVGIREMSTMVEVSNGEMLVIGGLIDEVESTDGSFMPIVGSIPLIRYLFGAEEKIHQKRELVILLTPRVI